MEKNRIFNSRLLNSATTFSRFFTIMDERPRMATIIVTTSSSFTGNRATFIADLCILTQQFWAWLFSHLFDWLTPWRSRSTETFTCLRIPQEQLKSFLSRKRLRFSKVLMLNIMYVLMFVHLETFLISRSSYLVLKYYSNPLYTIYHTPSSI